MAKQYGLPCPIARSLDIVGDRWTLLIIRDLLNRGPRKYVELAESLAGIAPNILSDRLKTLESHGIVEREFYEEHPPRARYKLTKKGAELRVVLLALLQWGQRHEYDGVVAVHEACGSDLKVIATCDTCQSPVPPRDMRLKFRRKEAAIAAGAAP